MSGFAREIENDDDNSPKSYYGYKVLRIIPSSIQNIEFLQNFDEDLDFWTQPGLINIPVDVMVPPEKLQNIKKSLNENNIKFNITVEDVQRMVDEERKEMDKLDDSPRRKRSPLFFFNKYRRSAEIYEYLDHLRNHYPSLMSIEDVGTTYNNKTLKLVRIKTERTRNKPIIWIDGGIHAREWIVPATTTYFIYKLLTEYKKNEEITRLLEYYDWYIMPLVNPDGYDYTFTKERFWRKNLSKSRVHNEGVDLNRNFAYQWNNDLTPPTARKPFSHHYIGPSAMSEIETQTISKILKSEKRRVKLFLTLHSYGQYISFPWGCKLKNVKEYDYLKRIGMNAAEKIRNLYGTEYTSDSLLNVLYPAPGNSVDWAYGKLGIKHSFVFELRDRGKEKFQLSKKYIIPVGEETWRGVQSIANDILGR